MTPPVSFEDIPTAIQARIFSFLIGHTADLTRIRSVSRHVKDEVVPLIPLSQKHLIRCCLPINGSNHSAEFIKKLMDLSHDLDDYLPKLGHIWKFDGKEDESSDEILQFQGSFFPGCIVSSIFFLDGKMKENGDEGQSRKQSSASLSEKTLQSYASLGANLCHKAKDTIAFNDLVKLWDEVSDNEQIFEPIAESNQDRSNKKDEEVEEEDDYVFEFRALINLRVPREEKYLKGYKSWDDAFNTGFLQVHCTEDCNMEENEGIFFPQKKHAGGLFRAYFSKKRKLDDTDDNWIDVRVPMKFVTMNEELWGDADYYSYQSYVIPISCFWSDFQQRNISEGVAIADGVVPIELRKSLTQRLDRFKIDSPVDYHPNSKNIVRDLVHPALFSYIKGVSPLIKNVSDVPPYIFTADNSVDEHSSNQEEAQSPSQEKDFWGRKYESSKYQWLPTYFDISEDGSCHICDYINNLVPASSYTDLYDLLSKLFQHAFPFIESVYSYVKGISPEIRSEGGAVEYDGNSCLDNQTFQEKYWSLRGQRLQVITKIVDYELKPNDSYEGVWHVEGMSHEEIVCTALYNLERDECLEGGDIEFKRAFQQREARHIFSTVAQCRHDCIEEIINEGLIPMGKVENKSGRLIVFPNSHVHRVTTLKKSAAVEMGSNSDDQALLGKRRIVVFFIVNPEKRIVSSREIAPQQIEAGGNMSRNEALTHRLELMRERKYMKQDWNVRSIELCEH